MEHLYGFELGKTGHVQAVVVVEDMESAHALRLAEAHDVHGGIGQAEEGGEGVGFIACEHIAVIGPGGDVASCLQVEVWRFFLQIRIYAHEAAEMHEEHQVEVGYGARVGSGVEPHER